MKVAKHTRAPADTTVVVAMSGGVDSSVAAALLVERGYNCIGVMMRLWAETGEGEGSTNKCCSLESVHDARRVADALGIPFYLINVEQPFKAKVVDFFIDGYSHGVTPNPCIECNRHIRFDYLLNYARRLGADYLATGHYARLRRGADGAVHLLKGVDEAKDQSYVLSVLGQAELNDVLFPVGDFPKAEVRRLAAARGLPIASKHDSMDLCFVFDDDYRRFLHTWAAGAMRPGPIVDRSGRVYGEHSGLPGYTIGQRKGLGISGAAEPLFVLELDYRHNTLVVGTAAELGRASLTAERVTWTLDEAPPAGSRVQCKIRYKAQAVDCTIFPQEGARVAVRFDEPLRDITPGQGAIFYDGDLCLGGGIIARSAETGIEFVGAGEHAGSAGVPLQQGSMP
ncbi:MAG: tRNA 2-thiouridine(34) synthase MnmA [Caldilineaceae bacterium]|nr:tRNA 2-thiouridine(34) synthase MnmA [Caldilineaceae bacterium]